MKLVVNSKFSHIATSVRRRSFPTSYPANTIYRDSSATENTPNTHPSPTTHKTYTTRTHMTKNSADPSDNAS